MTNDPESVRPNDYWDNHATCRYSWSILHLQLSSAECPVEEVQCSLELETVLHVYELSPYETKLKC